MNTARMTASDVGAAAPLTRLKNAGTAPARRMVTALVAVSLALWILGSSAAVLAAGPEDSVHNLYVTLLGTMKEVPNLGQSGRFARIEPVVRRLFDLPLMARLAVGASWAALSSAQQQQVATAFGGYISATYADRFGSYSGQQLKVTGQQPSGLGVLVRTRIVKASGESVSIDYLMRQNQDAWLISDIYLDGTISQLAIQHSEFGAILRREGFDGLITALNRKVDLLTVAKAS